MNWLKKIGLGLPDDKFGHPPNKARTGEDWYNWKVYMSDKYPIRFFLNEEFAPTFIWPITMPMQKAWAWIKYRTTERYHIIETGEDPGYMDCGDRMFYASFNLLKEFVEVEKANMWRWCHNEKLVGADAGIAHLKWEIGLEDELYQAENAKEIYVLYNWWVHTRPNRQKPWEGEDWDKWYEMKKEVYGSKLAFSSHLNTKEMTDFYKTIADKAQKLEDMYEDEDTKMFIRLAKLRKGLWI